MAEKYVSPPKIGSTFMKICGSLGMPIFEPLSDLFWNWNLVTWYRNATFTSTTKRAVNVALFLSATGIHHTTKQAIPFKNILTGTGKPSFFD